MSTKVNLDALIEREDFGADVERAGGRPRATISLSDLEANGFFQHSLRKPDFQRETTHWTPTAVYEVVRAFLDGDLIPAVILWESGNLHFVIDGAHRLSALMAWTRDDYGDGEASSAKFGGTITPEQKKVADKTRALIRTKIGAYSEFRGLVGQKITDTQKSAWVSRIGSGAIDIQWVTATTAQAAEASFFKINQSAVPIDATERRILQSRKSPTAISARCITRAGAGHKYWADFNGEKQEEIEKLGREVNGILYTPPTAKQPITTTDVPIAGQGYNTLPFVFDLVCLSNEISLQKASEAPTEDLDGSLTIQYMKKVKSRLELVSTNSSGSMGFHPLVYCYSSSGNFQANAFLAMTEFAVRLNDKSQKKNFTKVRGKFERYLLNNRRFVALTMNRLGAGHRSLPKIVELYWSIFQEILAGTPDKDILTNLVAKESFSHLRQLESTLTTSTNVVGKGGASNSTKSASYIEAAMNSPARCHICDAPIHANSITFDHVNRRSDGGSNRVENIKPAHPFCNSGYKS